MAMFLLTTMPSNDLGLVTRSLAVATELRERGHRVLCCNPAAAPRRVIADAGFENAVPAHPLFELMGGPQTIRGLLRFLRAGGWRRRHAGMAGLLRELLPALPLRKAPPTDEVWSMDHAGALLGMLDAGFVRACCGALLELVREVDPDVVVDFWNPMAVIAARAAGKPVVTVIQADAHPLAHGFLWWKRPPDRPPPSSVPAVRRALTELGLPRVTRLEELSVGDLTLVVGSPETDPLPPGADVTYVGSLAWQQPGAELPAWIEPLGRERPLVWVYSGNPRYGSAGAVLDSAVVLEATREALAAEDLDVVLTTGHHELPPSLVPLPPRFHHAAFLPGLAMASRCDVLVHHGGYGSCQVGLSAGKPGSSCPRSRSGRATPGASRRSGPRRWSPCTGAAVGRPSIPESSGAPSRGCSRRLPTGRERRRWARPSSRTGAQRARLHSSRGSPLPRAGARENHPADPDRRRLAPVAPPPLRPLYAAGWRS